MESIYKINLKDLFNQFDSKKMEDPLYTRGKFYGYPECCIEAFLESLGKRNQSKTRYIASRIVGYVPCALCADKILDGTVKVEDLVHEVNSRRSCAKPFIKVKDESMNKLEEDYKAYVERSKQKERFKFVLAAIKAYH